MQHPPIGASVGGEPQQQPDAGRVEERDRAQIELASAEIVEAAHCLDDLG